MILIAGPCVIESRDLVFKVANKLKEFADLDWIDFYFKSKFQSYSSLILTFITFLQLILDISLLCLLLFIQLCYSHPISSFL